MMTTVVRLAVENIVQPWVTIPEPQGYIIMVQIPLFKYKLYYIIASCTSNR